MAGMTGQSKNRYTLDGLRLFRRLHAQVARPVALLLALLFLFVNAAFAYTELHVAHASQHNAPSDLVSLDDNHELSSRPIESREFRSGREGSESSYVPKLDFRVPRSPLRLFAFLSPTKSFSPEKIPSLLLASSCEAPFSPRPPPVSFVQG